MIPISQTVLRLEKRERLFRILCREVVATLAMDQNKPYLTDLLVPIVEGWEERFNRILRQHYIEGHSSDDNRMLEKHFELAGFEMEGHPED